MFSWFNRLFRNRPDCGVQPVPDTSPGGAYTGLRNLTLTSSRPEGLGTLRSDEPGWAVLMEMTARNATVTLMSCADGTASIYFSNGGGVLGGNTHEDLRAAAIAFVIRANEFLDCMSSTTTIPTAARGRIIFYVRTDRDVLTAEADERELSQGRHALTPLYVAGHQVLTELRLLHRNP
jgi:hypothetical protein